MKTIEAIISMMVLLSFASLALIHPPQAQPGLNKYQLAEDIWRIAYLKGCFSQSVPSAQPDDEMRACLDPLFAEINEETSLQISCDNWITVATGDELPGENAITLHKTIVLNGVPETEILRVE